MTLDCIIFTVTPLKRRSMHQYPFIIRLIHWITFFLICGSLSSSFVMYQPDGSLNMDIINMHAINGTIIAILTLIRFRYRIKSSLPEPEGENKYQKKLTAYVHKSFYIIILLIAFMGISSFISKKLILLNADNIQSFTTFNINLAQVSATSGFLHSVFVFIFLILLFFHISGFILHQFIFKRQIIKKIWFTKN